MTLAFGLSGEVLVVQTKTRVPAPHLGSCKILGACHPSSYLEIVTPIYVCPSTGVNHP